MPSYASFNVALSLCMIMAVIALLVGRSQLMRYGFDSFSPSSWEPQEEGMMNIAARFSLSKKPRFIDPKGKKPND
jgi:hypothetical protein